MKTSSPTGRRHAFTLLELLAVVGVTVIAGLVILSMLARPRMKVNRVTCDNNLKQIGISFRIFANDNGDKFPMQVSTNEGGTREFQDKPGLLYRHFQVLSNELSTPKTVACPTDWKPAADFQNLGNSNISYFLGMDADETLPGMLLAGDRNLEIGGVPMPAGLHRLSTNLNVGFTRTMHDRSGYVSLADGSVQRLNLRQLREQLAASGDPTNRVVIP